MGRAFITCGLMGGAVMASCCFVWKYVGLVSPIPQKLESLQGSLSVRLEELKTVKKENRKRRKVIEAYQEMMSAGATGLHAVSC